MAKPTRKLTQKQVAAININQDLRLSPAMIRLKYEEDEPVFSGLDYFDGEDEDGLDDDECPDYDDMDGD